MAVQDIPVEIHRPPVPPDVVGGAEKRKPRWFPTAFTVLAAVLLAVWVASFVIPLRRL